MNAPVDNRLWCMHVSGMDEVHPAPDRATAQRWAAQFTVAHYRRNPSAHPFDPVMNFTVQEWPHAADRHAEGLAASIAANTWLVDPLTVDEQLVRNAVRQIDRAPTTDRQRRRPLWNAVMGVFGQGSTRSREICARFGLNPDKEVRK